MYRQLKTTCKRFEECGDIDIIDKVENWYGMSNIPLLENTGNIRENINKYKTKNVQDTSSIKAFRSFIQLIINIINKIVKEKINLQKDTVNEKFKLYNLSSIFSYYVPLIYIFIKLYFFSNFKFLIELKNNDIIKKWGNNYIYVFLVFCIITVIVICRGIYKIYICLNRSYSKYYIYLAIYAVVLIIINNIALPSFLDNLNINNKIKIIIMIIISLLVTVIFIVLTIIYYIKDRIVDDKFLIEDSLYFTLYNRYIRNILQIITTLLLLTTLIIKFAGNGFEYIYTVGMAVLYIIYMFVFYIHIYGVIEGDNYDRIGLYTIIFIMMLIFVTILFFYEIIKNLTTVCNKFEENKQLTQKDMDKLSPFKVIKTIIVSVVLLLLFLYLFGNIYTNDNWDMNKYKFYIFYVLYTVIMATSSLYTIKYSTDIHKFLWVVISLIQIKWVYKFIIFIWCLIKSFFKSLF